jgi:hypothetical protein
MEYFIGSIATIIAFVVLNKFVKGIPHKQVSIRYSQSHIHAMMGPMANIYKYKDPVATQARKHFQSNHKRIVFTENKAYWIADNTFLQADVIDGEILDETKKAVDLMSVDKVELDKMKFIVDKLTEGTFNDSSNPGY